MKLTHHDDGKQKYQSHIVGIMDTPNFYNVEHDIFSHDFFDTYGYGSTKEEAKEDFKRKFEYLLDEWIAFGKMLLDTNFFDIDMVEVDCFGKEVSK